MGLTTDVRILGDARVTGKTPVVPEGSPEHISGKGAQLAETLGTTFTELTSALAEVKYFEGQLSVAQQRAAVAWASYNKAVALADEHSSQARGGLLYGEGPIQLAMDGSNPNGR